MIIIWVVATCNRFTNKKKVYLVNVQAQESCAGNNRVQGGKFLVHQESWSSGSQCTKLDNLNELKKKK